MFSMILNCRILINGGSHQLQPKKKKRGRRRKEQVDAHSARDSKNFTTFLL